MTEKKVFPSSQVDQILPRTISQNYRQFVNFMTTAAESTERIGFGQDILQNLNKYRDFDTYKNTITKSNFLDENITAEDDELILVDSYGFPDENGVILINEEVILYREKIGNSLVGLQRGASGTTELETFKTDGEYLTTEPAFHNKNDEVKNLSVLFLVSMLETIHKSFTPDIESDAVHPEINRSTLLQNIKDFFQSKGTKLGIQALFKILYGENDVEVSYPGDRMIKPSTSTFSEKLMMRVEPVPDVLSELEILERYAVPSEMLGQEFVYRSYNDDQTYARGFIDYTTSYTHNGVDQYELWVNPSRLQGEVIANPKTKLTRSLFESGGSTTDIFTVTVESTIGFPDEGVLFVENEGIYYEKKTFNQFLNCRRGFIGVEIAHEKGVDVYGPYYIESKFDDKKSRSFPLGLVKSVDVRDGGLLHQVDDEVTLNGPGEIDPRETILSSIIENTNDDLVSLSSPLIGDPDITHGVSGVYFDKKNVFVSSSNLAKEVGSFGADNLLSYEPIDALHIIPRREEIRVNKGIYDKGNSEIGMFVDGVPAYSCNSNITVTQGDVIKFKIVNPGDGYINPSVVMEPNQIVVNPIVDKGKIVGFDKVTRGSFITSPSVRITSGEDAEFELKFDTFGRLIDITITDGGRFYIDTPTIQLVDSSDRGKGALIKCEVNSNAGEIISVEIVNSGIDYNPATTKVRVTPVGGGAIIEAPVEQYRFDRVKEIQDKPRLQFDPSGGFLFDNLEQNINSYAYTNNTPKLREELNDDGQNHSPILGWAYDGNPIYGPYGFANKTDDGDGVARMISGYKLLPDREFVIPFGYTEDEYEFASYPPNTRRFPMGTFVEDYRYYDDILLEGVLATEEIR